MPAKVTYNFENSKCKGVLLKVFNTKQKPPISQQAAKPTNMHI